LIIVVWLACGLLITVLASRFVMWPKSRSVHALVYCLSVILGPALFVVAVVVATGRWWRGRV
jgi:hypothetical protein